MASDEKVIHIPAPPAAPAPELGAMIRQKVAEGINDAMRSQGSEAEDEPEPPSGGQKLSHVFLVTVGAGIAVHLINKWLDRRMV